MSILNKDVIIDYLKQHKKELAKRYSIVKLGLFGSFATQSSGLESDIDIAYETSSRGLSFSQLLELEDELHRVFGKNIDLVNLKYMNPLIKRKALRDIIYV
jgi:predicted nucleotidyltransferase